LWRRTVLVVFALVYPLQLSSQHRTSTETSRLPTVCWFDYDDSFSCFVNTPVFISTALPMFYEPSLSFPSRTQLPPLTKHSPVLELLWNPLQYCPCTKLYFYYIIDIVKDYLSA
jgi:hypothetical protein